jgi:hypothetical protein
LESSCCWSPSDIVGLPWCFYPQAAGYSIISAPHWSADGVVARLRLKSPGPFPQQDISDLLFSVSYDSNTRLRVRITDANSVRWEPPDVVRADSCGSSRCGAADRLLDVSFTEDPFGFAVTRRGDGSTLFNSSAPDVAQPFSSLVYSEQFLSISSSLPAFATVHGLGEQVSCNLHLCSRALLRGVRGHAAPLRSPPSPFPSAAPQARSTSPHLPHPLTPFSLSRAEFCRDEQIHLARQGSRHPRARCLGRHPDIRILSLHFSRRFNWQGSWRPAGEQVHPPHALPPFAYAAILACPLPFIYSTITRCSQPLD